MTATTKKQSKSVAILDLLASRGKQGMRFREIQQALWDMSHDDGSRVPRGYWCDNLCSDELRDGLLTRYAKKGKDGLWLRNRRPHNGRPWAQATQPLPPTGRGEPLPDQRSHLQVGAAYLVLKELPGHDPQAGWGEEAFRRWVNPGDIITVTEIPAPKKGRERVQEVRFLHNDEALATSIHQARIVEYLGWENTSEA